MKDMKKLMMSLVLVLGVSVSGFSSGNLSAETSTRVNALNMKMAKELQLNNYQQAKVKAINAEIMAQIAEAEQTYQSNPAELEKACRTICAQRDKKVESVLSTDQYSRYVHSREAFYKYGMTAASELAQK